MTLRGVFWLVGMTLAVNLAVIYGITPLLPMALFRSTRPLLRRWLREALRLYCTFAALLTEGAGGTRIVLSGDPLPRPGEDDDRRLVRPA